MKRVLIIEDKEELMEEIADILQYEGYGVIQCNNGRKGIQIAKEHAPDLIICDILMPGTDGFEVLKGLKNNLLTSLIPFIFITALDELKNFRKGMDMGADDYLIKPFTRYELLNTLRARFLKQDIIEKSLYEVRDSIIYTIPHELRTPLNAIMGFSEIIRNEAENMVAEDISMMGKSIYESSNRLYEMIRKYVIYIDMEINKGSKQFCILNHISEIIEKIIINVALVYNRPDDYSIKMVNCKIKAMEEWFYFAIKELIDNAFKFSVAGQCVTVKSKLAAGSFELFIEDEGSGFPSGSVDRINVFAQFDRKIFGQEGIGMGLFLARRIIELHHGTLSIESTPHKGSIVHLKLPCII